MNSKNNLITKQYLTVKELSHYTAISPHTIYLWIQLKKIPYHKIGKLVRFNLEEINVWLQSQRIEPLDK